MKLFKGAISISRRNSIKAMKEDMLKRGNKSRFEGLGNTYEKKGLFC